MSKNTEIKFVGQPIFKQIIGLLDAINISSIVKNIMLTIIINIA
jgi:hypothetical protein